MNATERKKTERSKGFGFKELETTKLTKKFKKVYADTTSMEDIEKNKVVKHLPKIDAISYRKLHKRINNG